MKTLKKCTRFHLIVLLAICGSWAMAAASFAATSPPGPRQLLTARDSGAYGGWNEYWLKPDSPFNYLIVQAIIRADGRMTSHGQSASLSWNDWLLRARAQGKRVIAVVEPAGLKEAKDPIAFFKTALDVFMKNVDESQLYCITLFEENIFWDGNEQMLKELYAYSKSKYQVPVYQWYSPYAGQPGFGWPQLPADGWITDEYARLGPSFEEYMRAYAIHQLPIVHIVWAAPLMTDFDWQTKGDPAFDWQIAVCRKYNVPVSYFLWEGRGNTWGWSPEALPASKGVYSRVIEASRRASTVNTKAYEELWDDTPSLLPQNMTYSAERVASFSEDFRSKGGLTNRGAVIEGFRDIRWDGGPLELRPRRPGAASAVLQYPLVSEFPLTDIRVEITGKATESLKGELALATSVDGRIWTAPKALIKSGKSITSALNSATPTQTLWVRVTLKGQAKAIGDVPAFLESIKVTGKFNEPARKEVLLETAPAKALRWESPMGGAWLFRSEIENKNQLAVGDGQISTHGIAGIANTVAVKQKFVCPAGLDLRRITTKNYADQANYGATNTLGISLDGVNVVLERSTSGVANGEDFSLDIGVDSRFQGLKEFWVHLAMRNTSGAASANTNRITSLSLEGKGAQAPVSAQ